MIMYQPTKDHLYMDRLELKLRKNPSFKKVLMKSRDRTKEFFQDLANIANPNHLFTQNTIISISGLSGTGKSTIAISIGKIIFKNFTYRNIFFYDEAINQNARHFGKNSLVIRDENPMKGIYGIGANRITDQFFVMAETCRKHGLNLIMIEPSFRPTPITKIYLETFDMDTTNRITRCAMRDGDTMEYIGGLYIPVLPEDDPDWIAYNKEKDKFIQGVLNREIKGAKLDYRTIGEELADEIDLEVYNRKKKQRAFIMEKYPTLSLGEIDLILTFMEIRLQQIK